MSDAVIQRPAAATSPGLSSDHDPSRWLPSWILLGMVALGGWISAASSRLDGWAWLPWAKITYVADGCRFTVDNTDQLLTVVAWGLLVGSAGVAAAQRPYLSRNLASAALACAIGSAILSGSAWLTGDLLGSVQFPTNCPPVPTNVQLANETDRTLYNKATLAILPAVLILMAQSWADRSPRERVRGGLASRASRLRMLGGILLGLVAVLVVLVVLVVPSSLDDELRGHPTLPFAREIRVLSVLSLLALVPHSALRRPGVVALQTAVGLAFAQWLFIEQVFRDKSTVSNPNGTNVTVDRPLSLTGGEKDNLTAAESYYIGMLMLLLVTWALSWAIHRLFRERNNTEAAADA